jgi:YbbR domain-containing protein
MFLACYINVCVNINEKGLMITTEKIQDTIYSATITQVNLKIEKFLLKIGPKIFFPRY